jgi:hypothetical protein
MRSGYAPVRRPEIADSDWKVRTAYRNVRDGVRLVSERDCETGHQCFGGLVVATRRRMVPAAQDGTRHRPEAITMDRPSGGWTACRLGRDPRAEPLLRCLLPPAAARWPSQARPARAPRSSSSSQSRASGRPVSPSPPRRPEAGSDRGRSAARVGQGLVTGGRSAHRVVQLQSPSLLAVRSAGDFGADDRVDLCAEEEADGRYDVRARGMACICACGCVQQCVQRGRIARWLSQSRAES